MRSCWKKVLVLRKFHPDIALLPVGGSHCNLPHIPQKSVEDMIFCGLHNVLPQFCILFRSVFLSYHLFLCWGGS